MLVHLYVNPDIRLAFTYLSNQADNGPAFKELLAYRQRLVYIENEEFNALV